MDWQKQPNGNEHHENKECACCIKIEDSIVVFVCGDVELDKFKDCVKTVLELKSEKKDDVKEV